MKNIRRMSSSRRKFLTVSIGGAAGALGLSACATLGLPKIAKAQAGYEDISRKTAHCGDCVHFESPHSCTVVEGAVNPRGVCRYFLPKG